MGITLAEAREAVEKVETDVANFINAAMSEFTETTEGEAFIKEISLEFISLHGGYPPKCIGSYLVSVQAAVDLVEGADNGL